MDIDVIEKLRNYKSKKYIYGVGNLGQYLYRKLSMLGIMIDGFIVDGCIPESDYHVLSMEQVLHKEEKIGLLIIGHAAGYEKTVFLRNLDQFDDVLEIALPFDHHAHFSKDWVQDNQDRLNVIEGMLSDELSKRMLRAFLNSVSNESVSYVRDVFDASRSYFDNDIISIGENESFLEIGAFKGKSVLDFVKTCNGKYKRIIAIEPDKKNYEKLEENIINAGINADLYNIGCWNEHAFLNFDSDDKISRIRDDGDSRIEVDTVDNIVGKRDISIINLGVSAAQREILMGARNVISRNKPKMIIFLGSAYEELFLIPELLKQIRPDYQLIMRFVDCMPSRFFLFAI